MDRATCEYCGTTSLIELSQGQVTLKLTNELSGLRQTLQESNAQTTQSVLKSSEDTQKELQRLRLNQELATVELRLANAQSELRSLQRNSDKKNKSYKADVLNLENQIKRLNTQSVQIQKSISALDPIGSSIGMNNSVAGQSSGNRLLGCLGWGFLWMTLFVMLSGLLMSALGEAGIILGFILSIIAVVFIQRRRRQKVMRTT
jgi:hypothetical protein